MLKSRIFNFYEDNLQRDINEFERVTGVKPKKLECNVNTGRIWFEWMEGYLPFIQYEDELPKGIIGKYDGIPIEINEALDDGTIGIK